MGIVIAIIVVVAVLGAFVGGIVWTSRRRRAAVGVAEAAVVTPVVDRGEVAPMTGLESALAKVTDRSGRPIGERIDAESRHVDELRVPDDTGPVLRRVLDSIAPTTAAPSETETETETATETAPTPDDRDTGTSVDPPA